MAEIEKLMNVDIGDIEKIMNIATDDIEKVMGVEVPASAVWTGTRGVLGGGYDSSIGVYGDQTNVIDYKSIASTGAMSDFGDLSTDNSYLTASSNGTRGLFMGGYTSGPNAVYNRIEYITVGSTGDVTDAGDLTQAKADTVGASNGTNAFVFGGFILSGWAELDEIDYVAIVSTSNASDFGDISTGVIELQGGSMNDATRALRYQGAGSSFSYTNKYIDYITMASTGNTSDFGDMTVAGIQGMGGASSSTRGVAFGGRTGGSASSNVIAYVTVASTGDATDFGDLTLALDHQSSGNSSVSNLTKAETYGGYTQGTGYRNNIDYITIASTGDATSAGSDLTSTRVQHSALSGT